MNICELMLKDSQEKIHFHFYKYEKIWFSILFILSRFNWKNKRQKGREKIEGKRKKINLIWNYFSILSFRTKLFYGKTYLSHLFNKLVFISNWITHQFLVMTFQQKHHHQTHHWITHQHHIILISKVTWLIFRLNRWKYFTLKEYQIRELNEWIE